MNHTPKNRLSATLLVQIAIVLWVAVAILSLFA